MKKFKKFLEEENLIFMGGEKAKKKTPPKNEPEELGTVDVAQSDEKKQPTKNK